MFRKVFKLTIPVLVLLLAACNSLAPGPVTGTLVPTATPAAAGLPSTGLQTPTGQAAYLPNVSSPGGITAATSTSAPTSTLPPTAIPPAPTAAAPTGASAPSATGAVTATATTSAVLPSTGGGPLSAGPGTSLLADGLLAPDDLALAPDNTIYVSDVKDNSVRQFAGGAFQLVIAGLSTPEGLAFLPDGSLVIAEQGKNRLVRYDFNTKALTPYYQLTNNTGQPGVDGIAADPLHPGDLIIPDSPNGTLLRLNKDGKTVTTIASGLSRPVAAWVEPDGNILVACENDGLVGRVHPNGQIDRLTYLGAPDDVVEDKAGNIYISTLKDPVIHRLQAGTLAESVVAYSHSGAQGLAFDADGNLVASDPGNHRVIKIALTGNK